MGSAYVMMTVPGLTPVAIPVPLPIVAIDAMALVHVPPIMPQVSVADEPTQTVVGPVKGGGTGVIVTVRVAIHPVPSV
jgi:hypothetical protein